MNLASQVRHFLTFLAGLGGLFLSWNILAPEQVAEVNQAGADLIDPIMIILGAVAAGLARLLIGWIGSLIGRGAGEVGDKLSGIPVWLGLIGTAVALGGALPSCSALSGLPIKATVQVEEGALSYSSKGGLEMEYRPGYGQMPEHYKSTPSWAGHRSNK
jgi:hypothetical protein